MNLLTDYAPLDVLNLPDKLEFEHCGIVYVHRVQRPILSKTDLVVHFDLMDNRALRREVFTDEVLKLIGLEEMDYKRLGRFNLWYTAKIYEILKITWLRTNQKPTAHAHR